jgi:hypothetical protein
MIKTTFIGRISCLCLKIALEMTSKEPITKIKIMGIPLYALVFVQMLAVSTMSSCDRKQHPIDVNPTPVDTTHNPPTNTHIIDFGKISFEKNGELKNPPTYSTLKYYKDYARFYIDASWVNTFSGSDHFAINDIPCAKGTYPLQNFHISDLTRFTPESIYIVVVDLDQPAADFVIDSSRHYQNNFVEVLNYNPQDSTIEGRFQVTMFKDPMGAISNVPVPDSIAIRNGKFYVKIQRY